MPGIYVDEDTPQPRILVLGEGRLIDVVRRALDDAAADVIHLRAPADREIRRVLTPDIDAVVVISRDDRVSLRLALIVEGVRPGVRLIVTIYNRDLGAQVRRAVRNVRVMSMADIVASSLAGPCLGDELIAVHRAGDRPLGVRAGPDGPAFAPLPPRHAGIGRAPAGERRRGRRTPLRAAETLSLGLIGRRARSSRSARTKGSETTVPAGCCPSRRSRCSPRSRSRRSSPPG